MKDERNAYKIGKFADDLQNAIDSDKLKAMSAKNQQTIKDAALAIKMCGKVAIQIEALLDNKIAQRVFEKRMSNIEKEMDYEVKNR